MVGSSFDIHYFPKDGGTNEELYNVAEYLMFGLRYITLPNGDMLRAASEHPLQQRVKFLFQKGRKLGFQFLFGNGQHEAPFHPTCL